MARRGWLISVVGALIAVFGVAGAFGFPSEFKVRSIYRGPDGRWGSERIWTFRSIEGGLEAYCEGRPWGRIELEGDRPVRALLGEREVEAEGGALLTGGHPVPADLLPPACPKRLIFRQRVGKLKFRWEVAVKVRDVKGEEVLSLVAPGLRDVVLKGQLKLTEALIRGQVVLRQVWVEGMPWWLYEETPQRRSWLLSWPD